MEDTKVMNRWLIMYLLQVHYLSLLQAVKQAEKKIFEPSPIDLQYHIPEVYCIIISPIKVTAILLMENTLNGTSRHPVYGKEKYLRTLMSVFTVARCSGI